MNRLPIGGFPPIQSQFNRPLNPQRTSVMTLPRETNSTDLGGSIGTSTTSSKLSDTRILREVSWKLGEEFSYWFYSVTYKSVICKSSTTSGNRTRTIKSTEVLFKIW